MIDEYRKYKNFNIPLESVVNHFIFVYHQVSRVELAIHCQGHKLNQNTQKHNSGQHDLYSIKLQTNLGNQLIWIRGGDWRDIGHVHDL